MGISTKKLFGDCQLHIEWRSPDEPEEKKGQGRGNSGVFFNGIYEVQVLNSYQNRTYQKRTSRVNLQTNSSVGECYF